MQISAVIVVAVFLELVVVIIDLCSALPAELLQLVRALDSQIAFTVNEWELHYWVV